MPEKECQSTPRISEVVTSETSTSERQSSQIRDNRNFVKQLKRLQSMMQAPSLSSNIQSTPKQQFCITNQLANKKVPSQAPVIQKKYTEQVNNRAKIYSDTHFNGDDNMYSEVHNIAMELSECADDAAEFLQDETDDLERSQSKVAEVKMNLLGKGVSSKHAGNFLNKWIDFAHGQTKKRPHKEAGYVLEGIVDQKANELGCNLQVTIGTARPDYEYVTDGAYYHEHETIYDQDGDWTPIYDIRALYDLTSEKEALAGHITGKLLRMSDADRKNYPYVYDIWYDPVDFGGLRAKGNKGIELDEDAKLRLKIKKARKEEFDALADKRRESLRPRKKKNK